MISRRALLQGSSAAGLAFAGLKLFDASRAEGQPMIAGYGPLVPDPQRLLDLPAGFTYRIVSRTGEPMSDGLLTPGAFDAMACFPVAGTRSLVRLVRNHEIWPVDKDGGAFGPNHALLSRVPRQKIFDF